MSSSVSSSSLAREAILAAVRSQRAAVPRSPARPAEEVCRPEGRPSAEADAGATAVQAEHLRRTELGRRFALGIRGELLESYREVMRLGT